MRLTLAVITVLLFTLFSGSLLGQKGFSIGKVTVADLKRVSYAIDTSAQAVILFDVGHMHGGNLEFTRNLRIKILKKGGLQWGNWTFNSPSKSEFKVTVYNLENDQIVSEKATDKSIFREQVVDEFHVAKVFAPNVKVGSVIDISYQHFFPPFEWRFQQLVPVLYSQLEIEESPIITFKRTFFGFEKVTSAGPGLWTASNMPAFKSEPFVNSYSNYLTKFQFQVESIINMYDRRDGPQYKLSTTWPKVIQRLSEDTDLGMVLKTCCGFVNDFAKETRERKDLTTQQKIEAAIQYVRKNVKWNKRNTIFAGNVRNSFLTDHDGTTADINLILVTLLNKMDIKTYPIVLSTRDNGMIVEYSATISKFNFVAGLVMQDGLKMLVDATSPDSRPGMLPANCLNGKGLVIRRDSVQWEDLNQGFKNIKRQYTNLAINSDGVMTAKVTRDYEGYGYLEWVDTLKSNNKDRESLKNKITRENPDLKILSYAITAHDSLKGISQEIIDIDASQYVVDAGGELLLNPFPFFEYATNPLKDAGRKLPLDLWSPRDVTSTVAAQLPKGYAVREMPAAEKFSIPDGSASFTYLTSVNQVNNTVQFKIILKLNKPVYTENEYQELRQFFSHIVKKVNAPVRLGKT